MDNEGLTQYLLLRYNENVKHEQDTTKLYFQTLAILAFVLIATIIVLRMQGDGNPQIMRIILIGVPPFLVAWFGCYIFIFWEHHIARINLDYAEKLVSEHIGLEQDKVFLFHEDLLGVFNQAHFPPPIMTWSEPLRIKSVHWAFVLIGIPGTFMYFFCGISAFNVIAKRSGSAWAWAYVLVLVIIQALLLCIQVHCVKRERTLKKRLGVITRWDGDVLR